MKRGFCMNKNEKHSIRKYNNIATNYDKSFDGRFTAKFKSKMFELCTVSEGDKVLDVGCGNGSLINAIKQKGNIKVYGIDISPEMIKECRGRYKNIEFQISRAEETPFVDSHFDIVIICCVLHHLHDPKKFFQEAHRILKTNGTLIIGEPHFLLPVRKFIDWIVSPLLQAGDNKLFSHEKLKSLFSENGFLVTEVYKKGFVQTIVGKKNSK